MKLFLLLISFLSFPVQWSQPVWKIVTFWRRIVKIKLVRVLWFFRHEYDECPILSPDNVPFNHNHWYCVLLYSFFFFMNCPFTVSSTMVGAIIMKWWSFLLANILFIISPWINFLQHPGTATFAKMRIRSAAIFCTNAHARALPQNCSFKIERKSWLKG